MIVEIINTGSELMLGRILNTHHQWLCAQMASLGFIPARQTAVADKASDIVGAVRDALGRADLILVTGGLGPTSDDLTRQEIAELVGKPLRENSAAAKNIEQFFAQRSRPVPERAKVQALAPEGAIVLQNPNGTAPGLVLEINANPFRQSSRESWLVLLPGPPRELKPMFRDSVVPLIRKHFKPSADFACRSIRTIGIGESSVADMAETVLAESIRRGVEIGYCARTGQVDLRLSATCVGAEALVRDAEAAVVAKLGTAVFGCDEDELEHILVRLLIQKQKTVATAESCTGGGIANLITNVPGASAVFVSGFVTYSNAAKEKFLGVNSEILRRHGAVSEPVAREMAEGARQRTGADYALSVTGIAGPSGGSAEKPVGTVFVGLAGPAGWKVLRNFNPYDRETFKQVTALQALNLLRLELTETGREQPSGTGA